MAKIDLAAGKFKIVSGEMKDIFVADVDYNERQVEISSDYRKKGMTGYLDVGSDILNKLHMEGDNNIWDITLSRRYPTELTADIGMCKADIDLGGIPLTYLKLDFGAAEGTLSFSSPNPQKAEEVVMDAGAASLEVNKLGNIDFSHLTFDGGVGKFKLDFSGEYKGRAKAKVSIGLGKASIYIPSNLPVRIEAEDNFLSTVHFRDRSHYEVENNYFESKDFRESKVSLDLKIDVGLGSVDIIWTD